MVIHHDRNSECAGPSSKPTMQERNLPVAVTRWNSQVPAKRWWWLTNSYKLRWGQANLTASMKVYTGNVHWLRRIDLGRADAAPRPCARWRISPPGITASICSKQDSLAACWGTIESDQSAVVSYFDVMPFAETISHDLLDDSVILHR